MGSTFSRRLKTHLRLLVPIVLVALHSQFPTGARAQTQAPTQHFVCNIGYTPQECLVAVTVLRPRLPILVYNLAEVQLPVLVEAQAAMTQIFAEAGVEAIWINCPVHGECGGEAKRREFRIRIVSQAKGIVTHDPLGVAIPCDRNADTCYFYVFYAPIRNLAERNEARPGHVLGQVMTHELGHALLGPNAHALSGIMQAALPTADLRHLLYFTPSQAKCLRADLFATEPGISSGGTANYGSQHSSDAISHYRDLAIVARIEFLEWTESDQLRHSKFVGLREDNSARSVV